MKDKLNILVFVQDFLPLTQSFVYSEITGLAKGHNVLVISFNKTKPQYYEFENIKFLEFREHPFRRKVNSFFYRAGIRYSLQKPNLENELKTICSAFQPDVIHTHFGHQSLPIIENLKFSEAPKFISFHGIDASLYLKKSNLYRNKIREVFLRENHHGIFDSQFLIENLGEHQIYSDRFSVHYLGIDTKKFNRSSWPTRDPFTFVQVGAFRPKKGHIYTIRAFRSLLETTKEVRLVFAGSGAEEDRIKRYVNENGMKSFVSFLGDVDQDKVIELLNSAHAFVHPSITDNEGNTEGLPISIKEAMSMQLPIVSTRHSGIPELIENGIQGYLCEERNSDCLADKMERVMKMPYSKRNQQRILEDHNIYTSNTKLIEKYRKAILEAQK